MTKDKTGISKIIIAIAGKEIICTPDQIRDLKEALDKMYPAPVKVVKEVIRDWNLPSQPRWCEPYCLSAGNAVGDVSLRAI